MPLAALTPVLNDLLKKEGTSSSPYPPLSSQQQRSNSTDSSNTTDYLRKPSMIPNQVSSINDVSVVFFLIIFLVRTHHLFVNK
jgi:hypothetical protein